MSVIDLHTHILPRSWPDWTLRTGYPGWIALEHMNQGVCGCARMVQSLPGNSRRFFREIGANCWDPGVRLAEMDLAGVDVQVISTVPVMFSYWAAPGDALDLSRLLNDHIAEVCRAAPVGVGGKRFVGLATLPMQDPDLACRELERCVRELGLPGVQIGSNVNGLNLDAPGVLSVLEACSTLGACVFVHPWEMARFGQHGPPGAEHSVDRMERYWMPWLVGMPTDSTIAVMSLLFGGVLDRLPKLRVCIAHGAGSFPGTLGRIAHGLACRPDLFPPGARDPREYLARPDAPARFFADSLVHDAAALRHLVGLFGSARVCLGSDYPFPLGEERAGTLIRSMKAELGPDPVADLLGRSARAFLLGV